MCYHKGNTHVQSALVMWGTHHFTQFQNKECSKCSLLVIVLDVYVQHMHWCEGSGATRLQAYTKNHQWNRIINQNTYVRNTVLKMNDKMINRCFRYLLSTTASYIRSSAVNITSNCFVESWNRSGLGLILLLRSSICRIPFWVYLVVLWLRISFVQCV